MLDRELRLLTSAVGALILTLIFSSRYVVSPAMRTIHWVAVLLMMSIAMTAAAAPDMEQSEDTVFLVDNDNAAAFAISTGGSVIFGEEEIAEEIVEGNDIYEIGDNETVYPTVSREEAAQIIDATPAGSCPESRVEKFYAALVASLESETVVCTGEEASGNTDSAVAALKEEYVERLEENGRGINHIVLSDWRSFPHAAAIAAEQAAFPKLVKGGNMSSVEIDFLQDWQEGGMANTAAGGGVLKVENTEKDGFERESLGENYSVKGACHVHTGLGDQFALEGDSALQVTSSWANRCTANTALGDERIRDGDTVSTYFLITDETVLHSYVLSNDIGPSGYSGADAVRLAAGGDVRLYTYDENGDMIERRDVVEGMEKWNWYRADITFWPSEDDVDVRVEKVNGGGVWREEGIQYTGEDDYNWTIFSGGGYTLSAEGWFDEPVTGFKDPGSGRWEGPDIALGNGSKEVEHIQVAAAAIGDEGDANLTARLNHDGGGTERISVRLENGRQNISLQTKNIESIRPSINLSGEARIHHMKIFYRGDDANHRPLDSEDVSAAINESTAFLSERDMYSSGNIQYREGLFLSLVGVPPATRQDPLETEWWTISDPEDGDSFPSDMGYGDLNADGRIDAAVGRYPRNGSLASRMYLRSTSYQGKKAFVASQYLHKSWPVVLAHLGGGMYYGKNVEDILESQGKKVERAVEYRAEPEKLMQGMSPSGVSAVLDNAVKIETIMQDAIGTGFGAAASKAYLALKSLELLEAGLENYLEFDWSTAGFDLERAQERIAGSGESDIFDIVQGEGLDDAAFGPGLVGEIGKLVDSGLVSYTVYTFFWPERHDRLTTERLVEGIETGATIHYTGAGNGSAWLLPADENGSANNSSGHLYTGKKALTPAEIPANTASLVFDNSDMAASSESGMREAFLRKGSAAFIGSSAVNYAPFSSDIAADFYRSGYTTGQGLVKAVNGMREDSLSRSYSGGDDISGVKEKVMASFRLYGNPEARKDPEMPEQVFDRELDCSAGECELHLSADVRHSVVAAGGERFLDVTGNGHLLATGRPVIPLLKATHRIPEAAEIDSWEVEADWTTVENVSLPVVRPLSHGAGAIQNVNDTWFPETAWRIDSFQNVDGSQELEIVHAAVNYSAEEREANVLDTLDIEIAYSSPFGMEMDVPGTAGGPSLDLTVWSESDDPDAEILVNVGDSHGVQTRTVETNISEGQNDIDVGLEEMVEQGNYSVEAVLISDGAVIGSGRGSFEASGHDGVNVSLEAPGTVQEAERFAVEAAIANTGKSKISPAIVFNGSAGVQAEFLHPATFQREIGPGETASIEVPFRAFSEGAAVLNLSVRNQTVSERFTVAEKAPQMAVTRNDARIIERADGYRSTVTSDARMIELRRAAGRIRIVRERGREVVRLETRNATLRKNMSGSRRTLEAGTRSGRALIASIGGRRTAQTWGQMDVDTAENLDALLMRERRKLMERYRVQQ